MFQRNMFLYMQMRWVHRTQSTFLVSIRKSWRNYSTCCIILGYHIYLKACL